MFSDSLFVAGFDEYLEKRLSKKAAPTYVYLYDFESKMSLSSILGGGDFYFGVCHGDDLQVFFPVSRAFGFTEDNIDENLLKLRDALIEMWVNNNPF